MTQNQSTIFEPLYAPDARTLGQVNVPDTTVRRAAARKFVQHFGIAMDAATALAPLLNSRSFPRPTTNVEGLTALTGQRVFLPLIDPLVAGDYRRISHGAAYGGPLPDLDSQAEDGVPRIVWDSPQAKAEGFAAAYSIYQADNGGFTDHTLADVAEQAWAFGIDSWDQPLALYPVRHEFRDGSPAQVRWTSVDGSRRVWLFRTALAAAADGVLGADHPYVNAGSDHNADPVVAWRQFLAVTRTESGADIGATTLAAVCDWADVLLTSSREDLSTVAGWMYRRHSGREILVLNGGARRWVPVEEAVHLAEWQEVSDEAERAEEEGRLLNVRLEGSDRDSVAEFNRALIAGLEEIAPLVGNGTARALMAVTMLEPADSANDLGGLVRVLNTAFVPFHDREGGALGLTWIVPEVSAEVLASRVAAAIRG